MISGMWRLALVLVAIVFVSLRIPTPLVEHYYAFGIYPLLQPALTRASNLTTFSCLDLLIIGVAAAVVALTTRDLRRVSRSLACGRFVIRIVTVACALYVIFTLTWGLNYQREAVKSKVSFDAGQVTPAAALQLAQETVARVNSLYGAAHAAGWHDQYAIDQALASSFSRVTDTLHLGGSIVPGRPKRSLLDLYFRRAGVAGMTDPFFLETLVASDTLPFERPHVIAHEWAHLAGVTDEGEANFVGWLACLEGTAPHRYSGWLFLYNEVVTALPRDAAPAIAALLEGGPRADLEAIRLRYHAEVNPRLSAAGWQVYDEYLRVNRVASGARSYGEVVELVLGSPTGVAARSVASRRSPL